MRHNAYISVVGETKANLLPLPKQLTALLPVDIRIVLLENGANLCEYAIAARRGIDADRGYRAVAQEQLNLLQTRSAVISKLTRAMSENVRM